MQFGLDNLGTLPMDPNLIGYYDYIDNKVLNLPNSKEQVITIAQLVRMSRNLF